MPILGGAFPPNQQPSKGEKKGTFIYGYDAKAKNSVKCPRGFSEYRMTKCNNFRWGLPQPATPKGEKGIFLRNGPRG